jgi:5S rRNA maturation endonuclease (ribonuclease M5)
MNLTPKNNLTEFNRFLFKEVDLDIYRHKFLKDYVDKATQGIAPLYELSVINTSADGWIMILHGDILLVYGDNWTENQIQEINEVFDLNKYTNYSVAGDSALIDKLLEFYKPKNFEIEKRRILYRTTEIKNFNSGNLQIRLGSLNQLNELARMLQEYYHEEYNGLNDKTIEDMQQRIFSVILTKKIYVLLDNDENILSFCTIIDPDIGIMFTKNEYRNNGYAKIILSYCSHLLQQKNKTVYVMTDRDKPESNIVCEAVGFKPYYNYVMTKINCG